MNVTRSGLAARLLVIVVVLAGLCIFGMPVAYAACSPVANTGGQVFQCAHEGEARSAATAYANANLSQVCAQRGGGGPGEYGTSKKEANYYQPGYYCVSPTTGNPLGTTYYSPIYNFATSCLAAPALPAGMFLMGGGSICHEGCEYGSSGSGNTTTTFFPGTPDEMQFQDRHGGNPPTGNTCDPNGEGPRPVTQETCKTVGTLTQCMRPDGKHCAQASTGKKFCWAPNEAGTKVSDNDAATKAPQDKPNLPPIAPPANNGQWEQTGSGTTIINNNGATTNYNTNTYQSSSGPTGDGGGATNPDGSEEPGEGEDDKDANTVSGGSGCAEAGAPTCSGATCTAELFAILIQQWRSRCADEDARSEFGTDATNGAGDAAGDDTGGVLSSLWDNEVTTPTVDYNKVNIGGGLVIPTVTIFDQTWTAPAEFYDALAIIKFIVIAAFSIAGIVVLWNR